MHCDGTLYFEDRLSYPGTFFLLPLYVAALGLMALVKTPLGKASHGAQRWLKLGPIQFQPAEIAKIAVIVCLSYMIVHMGKQVRTLKACMVLAGMGGLLALIAYVCTDNLSTAIIIFCITAGLIFVAHPDTKIFLIIAGVGIALAVDDSYFSERNSQCRQQWKFPYPPYSGMASSGGLRR